MTLALAVAALLLAAPGAAAPPRTLACTTVYGGVAETRAVTPTTEPYTVAEIAIGKRFAFKAVWVEAPVAEARLALYAYQATPDGPVLLHEVTYRPPYPTGEGPNGFTGEHFVYELASGSELRFWCAWGAP